MTKTPDTSTLQNLLTRVEAAAGPDRALDLAIWSQPYTDTPFYTSSVDAALELVELMLPGRGYKLYKTGASVDAHPYWFVIEPRTRAKMKRRQTAPLAILTSLLKVLVAQEAARKETA